MNETKKALTPQEKWEQATIANNFIFYKVMRNNPDVCKELLEILLEFKIERIEMSQEEVVDIDFASKGIRMDVYVKDADGLKAYNIEMIWRVSCQYQRTKKGQFQSLTGFDHYDIRGFNKLSYPRSMVRRKLLHYANGNQFYRKIQLS